jgi:predicted N-acetyltransferase YhbS
MAGTGGRTPIRRDFLGDPSAYAAYAALIHAVFDQDVVARDRICGPARGLMPFGVFDDDGACVANVDVVTATLVVDGARTPVAGLRSVAVDPAWRGRGLFRATMEAALAWCDATVAGPVILYTEEPPLYTRFGFAPVLQHAFGGPPPAAVAEPAFSRRLSIDNADDLALARRLLAARAPVSNHVAIDEGSAALFLTRLWLDPDLALDHLPGLDALVVSEEGDDDTVRIVDLVAPTVPPLARILAALGIAPARVTTMFPPDRLAWIATPEPDDAGLMVRGKPPAAFAQPFGLPVTAEF